MDSKDNHINIEDEDVMQNRKRGDILFYSVSQVAALLGEEDSNIRYYTNVFDNILKIEISNKELRYTLKDIDKLEFLINLKNKGMTIKQIQTYCEELPLDNEDSIDIKEVNSLSIDEVMDKISKKEDEQFDDLKEFLTTEINEISELLIQKIDERINKKLDSENEQINDLKKFLSNEISQKKDSTIQEVIKLIADEQNNQLNSFKDNILTEIKEYIDCKFDSEYQKNNALYNKCSEINNLISEKLSLEDSIKLELNKCNEESISRYEVLADEIKRFRAVIEQAYYIQHEIDNQKKHKSFIEKIFGSKQ